MTQVRITIDGRPHEATLEEQDGVLHVTVDGRTFRVTDRRASRRTPRGVLVTLDDTTPIEVERLDLDHVRADDMESTYRIDSVSAGAGAGVIGAEGARIHPPMPGKIVSLRVKEGEAVEAGQVLVVLEAMKMQNEVISPAAGVVTEIHTKTGATVDTRDVLVVLGPREAPGTAGREKEVAA